jgi:hypothetical protein
MVCPPSEFDQPRTSARLVDHGLAEEGRRVATVTAEVIPRLGSKVSDDRSDAARVRAMQRGFSDEVSVRRAIDFFLFAPFPVRPAP